jgi:predicted ATPase
MLEEPENGLYPRHLGKLVDRLKELSEHTQVIITTHNPFLLDYFDDQPESIFVVNTPDEETGTTITSPDPERLAAMLEHTSLGELLFSEVLA